MLTNKDSNKSQKPQKLKIKLKPGKIHLKQKLSESSAFTEIFKSTAVELKHAEEGKEELRQGSEGKCAKQGSALFSGSSNIKASLPSSLTCGSFKKDSSKSKHERGKASLIGL